MFAAVLLRHRIVPLGFLVAVPKRTWSRNTRKTGFDVVDGARSRHRSAIE